MRKLKIAAHECGIELNFYSIFPSTCSDSLIRRHSSKCRPCERDLTERAWHRETNNVLTFCAQQSLHRNQLSWNNADKRIDQWSWFTECYVFTVFNRAVFKWRLIRSISENKVIYFEFERRIARRRHLSQFSTMTIIASSQHRHIMQFSFNNVKLFVCTKGLYGAYYSQGSRAPGPKSNLSLFEAIIVSQTLYATATLTAESRNQADGLCCTSTWPWPLRYHIATMSTDCMCCSQSW